MLYVYNEPANIYRDIVGIGENFWKLKIFEFCLKFFQNSIFIIFIKIPNPSSHKLEMGYFWADSAKIDA